MRILKLQIGKFNIKVAYFLRLHILKFNILKLHTAKFNIKVEYFLRLHIAKFNIKVVYFKVTYCEV